MTENRCIICGAIVPEGTQVCPICESDIDEEYIFMEEHKNDKWWKDYVKCVNKNEKYIKEHKEEFGQYLYSAYKNRK